MSQASLEVISANKNLSDPPPMLSGEGVEAEKGEKEEEVEQLKRTVEQLQKENTILKVGDLFVIWDFPLWEVSFCLSQKCYVHITLRREEEFTELLLSAIFLLSNLMPVKSVMKICCDIIFFVNWVLTFFWSAYR